MDINSTIERHRKQLVRIVATLCAMIGLVEGKSIEHLSLPIYRKVLRILRPAESAVRRLIVVAARGISLKPPQKRTASRKPAAARKPASRATFRLFDPRQRFTSAFAWEQSRGRIRVTPVKRLEPRVRVISFDPRIPLLHRQLPPVIDELVPAPPPDGSVNASRLCRRLAALKSALEDLPRQALRYARWQAKPQGERCPQFSSALRPGKPPGFRNNPIHKVDEILAECDWLARQERLADTS